MERVESKERVNKSSLVVAQIIGWICAILSLFIYPFVFGALAVVLGIVGSKNGSKAGIVLIVTSIIFMGIGLIYSGVILNYTRHYLGF